MTQFALVSGVIVDVVSGEAVVGSEAAPVSLLQDDIIPSLNAVLLKVKDSNSNVKVYAVDLETSKVLWNAQLGAVSKGKAALGTLAKMNGASLESPTRFVPGVDKNGNILYADGKTLFLIDKTKGSIKWKSECNPGAYFFDNTQTFIYVVERVGAVSMSAAPLGKKLNCLFAKDGNKRWAEPMKLEGAFCDLYQVNDRQLLVATASNIDLYDLSSAKAVWKKPFSTPNLKSMEYTKDGIMVYYGNKQNLVNVADGKAVWNKPVTLEDVEDNVSAQVRVDYKKSYVIFTPTRFIVYDNTTNKKKWSMFLSKEDRVAFDDANNKVLIISGKKIYVADPDNDAKKPSAVDAKLSDANALAGYKASDNGYFVYGAKEYIMVSTDGKVLAQKTYPQLKTGGWARAGLVVGSVITGIGSTTVTSGDQTTGLFCSAEQAQANGRASSEMDALRREMKENAKQKKAVRSSDDEAIFMTSKKENGKEVVALAIVDKNNGKEIKTVTFSNDRDVVYEIDFNTNHVYYFENGKINSMSLK